MDANTQAAKTLGSIAYASELPCAPALDKGMCEMIKAREVGDQRTIKEMKAWIAGYTEAMLAAA